MLAQKVFGWKWKALTLLGASLIITGVSSAVLVDHVASQPSIYGLEFAEKTAPLKVSGELPSELNPNDFPTNFTEKFVVEVDDQGRAVQVHVTRIDSSGTILQEGVSSDDGRIHNIDNVLGETYSVEFIPWPLRSSPGTMPGYERFDTTSVEAGEFTTDLWIKIVSDRTVIDGQEGAYVHLLGVDSTQQNLRTFDADGLIKDNGEIVIFRSSTLVGAQVLNDGYDFPEVEEILPR